VQQLTLGAHQTLQVQQRLCRHCPQLSLPGEMLSELMMAGCQPPQC